MRRTTFGRRVDPVRYERREDEDPDEPDSRPSRMSRRIVMRGLVIGAAMGGLAMCERSGIARRRYATRAECEHAHAPGACRQALDGSWYHGGYSSRGGFGRIGRGYTSGFGG